MTGCLWVEISCRCLKFCFFCELSLFSALNMKYFQLCCLFSTISTYFYCIFEYIYVFSSELFNFFLFLPDGVNILPQEVLIYLIGANMFLYDWFPIERCEVMEFMRLHFHSYPDPAERPISHFHSCSSPCGLPLKIAVKGKGGPNFILWWQIFPSITDERIRLAASVIIHFVDAACEAAEKQKRIVHWVN